jgi:hypothetical protein
MDRIARQDQAEKRMLSLLSEAGLPAPDAIECGPTSMKFLWTDRKVAVVIDFDDHEMTQIVPT